MRKWLGIGMLVIVLGCVVAYWRLAETQPDDDALPMPDRTRVQIVPPKSNDDGDAEPSDAHEPLVVDRGPQAEVALRGEFGAELEMVPRVALTPGMTQPPRPDAEPGKTVRMPYADE